MGRRQTARVSTDPRTILDPTAIQIPNDLLPVDRRFGCGPSKIRPEQALAVSNAIAPEHLELMVADADSLLPLVRHAGAVFCGPWSPASVGDYLAGPNHVLPTNGSARFSEALRVDDFVKHVHVVTLSEAALTKVAPHVAALADAEGLAAHADSVRRRQQ